VIKILLVSFDDLVCVDPVEADLPVDDGLQLLLQDLVQLLPTKNGQFSVFSCLINS
jgi:hypothetical protein